MKILPVFVFTLTAFSSIAEEKVTSVDFVQILNGKHAEALFYYQQNWEKYRKQAQSKGYIESYRLMKTDPSEQAPFHLMLLTTYPDQAAYDKREEHFQPIMAAGGGLKLLNDSKPAEFRKTLFSVNGKSR